MSQRRDFIALASVSGANVSALSCQFGISRATAYKWLARHQAEGSPGLQDRSSRPSHSPGRTSPELEALIVSVRDAHPVWGSKKILAWLARRSTVVLPSASTTTEILRRHGKIGEDASSQHRPFVRFEKEAPNELWQMDFKGWVPYSDGVQHLLRCFPLTILDDHSRFMLCIGACGNEQREPVQAWLTTVFREYGMPAWMTMDNGNPWGTFPSGRWTKLGVWLMQLGIGVSHSSPGHPQTQGKDERFHRTFKAELLQSLGSDTTPFTLAAFQIAFDRYRIEYNEERPHQALDFDVPADRYRTSERLFPEQLPVIVHADGTLVRRVQTNGVIRHDRRPVEIGKGFATQEIALRAAEIDGIFDVMFGPFTVGRIDMRDTMPSMYPKRKPR